MTHPKILSIACITPPHLASMQAVVQHAQHWVGKQDITFQAKVTKIFEKAEVDNRHTVLPLSQVFSPMTLDETNAIYKEEVVTYSEIAVREALNKAKLNATDIDCLITISCTGHMAPSLDAFLINRLGMKPNVQRMPVMEMGCIGGVAGLIYAENYLRAYPDRYVALVCAELSSVTFQREDFSWANIVSTAIFGDGIACTILGATKELRPQILGSRMHHFQDTTDLLGFNLSSTGFGMVLDEKLPSLIRQEFSNFTDNLLNEHKLTLVDIQHFVIHPGGKKILKNIEMILRRNGKNVDDSWAVLKQYGNMSSATVLFILNRFMERTILPQEKALMIAFGPGLTAGSLLLEWANE